MSLGKFLTKHVGELRVLGSALSIIVSILPLKSKEKSKVVDAIETITNAADSIEATLERIEELSMTKEQVQEIVAAKVAELVASELEKALASKTLVDRIGKLFGK